MRDCLGAMGRRVFLNAETVGMNGKAMTILGRAGAGFLAVKYVLPGDAPVWLAATIDALAMFLLVFTGDTHPGTASKRKPAASEQRDA